MTDSTPTPEGEELLVCAKYKNSTRFTGTLPLAELIAELENRIPVDEVYVQVTLPTGEVQLKRVAALGIRAIEPQPSSLGDPPPTSEPDTMTEPRLVDIQTEFPRVSTSDIPSADEVEREEEVMEIPEGGELPEPDSTGRGWLKRLSGN